MENKFYTPQIEEFIHGLCFEYKVYDEDLDKYKDEWINAKFNNRDGLGHDLTHQLREETIRVKYLTKEDIEECGFLHLKEDGDLLNFQKIVDAYSFYEIAYDLDEQLLTIEYYYQPEMVAEVTGHVNSAIRFKGTIKNKSELKQILKMIL